MADLFRDQMRLIVFGPAIANEDFAEEGIQWLFDAFIWLSTSVLLRLETCQQPFQYRKNSFGRILLMGRRSKELWLFNPVSWELGGGLVG